MFTFGIIFKQIEDAHVQIHDPELRKILNPTTADLRFSDYLVKHVTENRDDVFLDGTGWEGGDEWIRAQFSAYLHALLAAVLQPGRTDTLSRDGDEGGHVKHLLCCCQCVWSVSGSPSA